jgi:diguanylate cyclase (GGDEF)-like protein
MAKRSDVKNRDDAVTQSKDEAMRESDARTAQDTDQTAADIDQTQSDSDQAASDSDQVVSNTDQALADRDQHASDRDQAAADWERTQSREASEASLAGRAHRESRVERDAASRERHSTAEGRARATSQRLSTAARRDEVAQVRDLTAEARDRAAQARDEAAEARDRAAEARERRALEAGDLNDAVAALKAIRLAGASLRDQAARERKAAAADRRAAARDREQAETDRRFAGLDELTGVFRRGTGELALTHEIDRARRSRKPVVFVMLDVDALKAVNDSDGHPAGDALLREVATAIISTMRSYDVTVRWGGDEFVCALSDVTPEVAAARVAAIQRFLEERRPGASLSAGLTALQDGDTLQAVIARADRALYENKAAPRA